MIDKSLLRSFNWTLTIERAKPVTFFVQEVQIPTMSIDTLSVAVDPGTYRAPGDKIFYDETVNMQIIMDESMEAYSVIHDWMWEIRNPEDNRFHKIPAECFSDISLTVRGNNQQVIGVMRFVGCWPASLQGPTLKTTEQEDSPVTTQVSFGFNYFRWYPSGYPPIPDKAV